MSDTHLSGVGIVGNHHHDPHHRHTTTQATAFGDGGDVGDGNSLLFSAGEGHFPGEATTAIDPNEDPVGFIEAAALRLKDDVGVLAEEGVIHAFSILRATDMPAFLRMRHLAKVTNQACSLTTLDKMVRQSLPSSGDDPSAIDELVALARAQCELTHDPDRKAVAIIPLPSHREVWRVGSPGFEQWLRSIYWRAKQEGLADTSFKAAIATLVAAGINDGPEVQVHTRAAKAADGYFIDLCDEHWRVVHVTARGWKVIDESPILFVRTTAMRALPVPDRNGMRIEQLWKHTNVPPASHMLVLAWLIECLRADTPFPVLELVGEQGSAKSTTQNVLRSLIDPNKVGLRGRPKTVEDIFVAGFNNWLVSYENLSSLTAEQQDALCTLATGGGYAARQLYTNGEEHILETKRPVVLNGIAVVATRPDLIDRVIHVDMPVIASDRRRDEADTTAGWEQDRPGVFAALLDVFVMALARLPSVVLTEKQRMADFERLGEAVCRALGYDAGEFQKQYAEMVRAGIDRALESNPVAQAVDAFMEDVLLPWQGTTTHLYDRLDIYAKHDRGNWPRSPKGLSDQLRRIAPAFRAKGVEITHVGHTRQGGQWRIAVARAATHP